MTTINLEDYQADFDKATTKIQKAIDNATATIADPEICGCLKEIAEADKESAEKKMALHIEDGILGYAHKERIRLRNRRNNAVKKDRNESARHKRVFGDSDVKFKNSAIRNAVEGWFNKMIGDRVILNPASLKASTATDFTIDDMNGNTISFEAVRKGKNYFVELKN